jgi:membrane protease YdiL (CAAX protease family)
MMRRERLVAFLAGDRPDEPPGAIDRRTFDLLGLRLPALATAALLLVSLLLLFQHNHDILPRFGPVDPRSLRNQAIERFVLFGMVPVGLLLALREDPRRYGLQIGDARRGLILLGVLSAVTLPVIVLVARIPEIRDWYAPSMSTPGDVALSNVLDLVPAEFLIRGFLLFALLRVVGPLGVVIAIVPFAFTHIGKPDPEILSTLGGGLVFGWLNWRTGSILYSGIYHVLIQTTVIIAAAGWASGG